MVCIDEIPQYQQFYNGIIAEVIVYGKDHINEIERTRTESYLAIKFGITPGSSIYPVRYYSSKDGQPQIIWQADADFQNDIIGNGVKYISLGSVNKGTPLPIELSEFTAHCENQTVEGSTWLELPDENGIYLNTLSMIKKTLKKSLNINFNSLIIKVFKQKNNNRKKNVGTVSKPSAFFDNQNIQTKTKFKKGMV